MGQGHYQAIGFGCINPDIHETDVDGYSDEAAWYETASAAAESTHSVKIRTAYEADPNYCAVILSVSDEVLARYWDLPVMSSMVMPLSAIADGIAGEHADNLAGATSAWEDLRAAAQKAGKGLPEGQLLLINDYD